MTWSPPASGSPEVLEPVFDRMATQGYLSRDGDRLLHAQAGARAKDGARV
ncbi:hypothetical protein ACIG0C_25345 [Kitasatospora aureofaciens]|nr:hypothetical protein [Kitasatospora aureofaciens]